MAGDMILLSSEDENYKKVLEADAAEIRMTLSKGRFSTLSFKICKPHTTARSHIEKRHFIKAVLAWREVTSEGLALSREYKISWEGWGADKCTWEPERALLRDGCSNLISPVKRNDSMRVEARKLS